MSVQDIINSGGSQYTLGGTNYDPKQYNVNGQEVGQTPLSDGRTISTDFNNDFNTDWDHKQNLVQATQHARGDQPRDEENYIYGGISNHPYEKVHNTRADQMETAFVNYMVAALNPNITAGQAVFNAGQALFNQQAVVRRQNNIDEMEAKGYNPQDIEKYIQTGKPEDLIATKGKEEYDAESGTIFNPLTGVVRSVGVSPAVQQKLDTNSMNAYSQMQQNQANTLLNARRIALETGRYNLAVQKQNGIPGVVTDATGNTFKNGVWQPTKEQAQLQKAITTQWATQNKNQGIQLEASEEAYNMYGNAQLAAKSPDGKFQGKTAVQWQKAGDERNARGFAGGNASQTPEQIQHHAEQPGLLGRTWNTISQNTGYGPTGAQLEYNRGVAGSQLETAYQGMQDKAIEGYNKLIAGGFPEAEALKLVNSNMLGLKMKPLRPSDVGWNPLQNVPDAAINALKQNPKLRTDFDNKYGYGASQVALGG